MVIGVNSVHRAVAHAEQLVSGGGAQVGQVAFQGGCPCGQWAYMEVGPTPGISVYRAVAYPG